jgi:hypothetical protein
MYFLIGNNSVTLLLESSVHFWGQSISRKRNVKKIMCLQIRLLLVLCVYIYIHKQHKSASKIIWTFIFNSIFTNYTQINITYTFFLDLVFRVSTTLACFYCIVLSTKSSSFCVFKPLVTLMFISSKYDGLSLLINERYVLIDIVSQRMNHQN